MASAIDLCQTMDVRLFLGLPQGDGDANTQSSAGISAGPLVVVTPASMIGIVPGAILLVGTAPITEYVVVNEVTDQTFTAAFNLGHTGPVPILGVTDQVLGRMITANSARFMRMLGRLAPDMSVPAHSTLVEQSTFSEWYDGNGNDRLLLRQTPVASVQVLTINGINIPESADPRVAGFVIDDSGRSIAIRSGFGGYTTAGGTYAARFTKSWCFARGYKNVNVQYTAGFASTPPDITDCCIEVCALDYRRRNWVDQVQNSQTETVGTIRYRDWEFTPKIQRMVEEHKRRWS